MKWLFPGFVKSNDSRNQSAKLHLMKARLKLSSVLKTPMQSVSGTSSAERCLLYTETDVVTNGMLLLIGTLCRSLSYRVSALWNIRDSSTDGLSKKIGAAVALHLEVKQILRAYQQCLTRYSSCLTDDINVKQRTFVVAQALVHAITKLFPHLSNRIEWYIRATIKECTSETLTQYFKHHPKTFMVLQQRSNYILAALQYVSLCGAYGPPQSTTQTEQAIFGMLKKYSIEPVYSTVQYIELQDFLSAGEMHQVSTHFTALAFNSTLQAFLEYFLSNDESFDESGVYQLFRIILKLQEYIAEIKKELKLDGAQRLITDITIWTKAERILQTLNAAIFAEPGKVNPSAGGSVDSPNRSRCRNVLTEAETAAWTALANPYHCKTARSSSTGGNSISNSNSNSKSISTGGHSGGGDGNKNSMMSAVSPLRWLGARRQRRKRHKGTVFVVLELDMQNL